MVWLFRVHDPLAWPIGKGTWTLLETRPRGAGLSGEGHIIATEKVVDRSRRALLWLVLTSCCTSRR